MNQYTIGLDFGTNSCRCIIIDINNGKEISSYVHNYKFGKNGVITNKKTPLVARQHPKDYTDSIIKGIKIHQNFVPKFNDNTTNKKKPKKTKKLNEEVKKQVQEIKDKDLEKSVVKLGLSINIENE